MKENLTELVFILDRSGSMRRLEEETIEGFNGLIEKQKTLPGETRLTTVLFDNEYTLLHDRMDLQTVKPLTREDYFARGMTALLDAVGKTIDLIGNRLSETPEAERPSKVLFVITTDGMENASREYTAQRVRDMITHQKEKYSWEFLFLGANIDAVATAKDIGISADRAAQYCCDEKGLKMCYNEALELAIDDFRDGKEISNNWKKSLEADYKRRSNKTR